MYPNPTRTGDSAGGSDRRTPEPEAVDRGHKLFHSEQDKEPVAGHALESELDERAAQSMRNSESVRLGSDPPGPPVIRTGAERIRYRESVPEELTEARRCWRRYRESVLAAATAAEKS